MPVGYRVIWIAGVVPRIAGSTSCGPHRLGTEIRSGLTLTFERTSVLRQAAVLGAGLEFGSDDRDLAGQEVGHGLDRSRRTDTDVDDRPEHVFQLIEPRSNAVMTEAAVPPRPNRTSVVALPRIVTLALRLEGAVALTLLVLAYRATGANWWLFAVLFLVPDLTMLGYLVNRRIGAPIYNLGHTYLTPAALALAGFALGMSTLWVIALIWGAHIGFDRMLGYGLKYPHSFHATHLGWRGEPEPS